jgi:Family of unknown function (DUF6338)
MELAAIFILSLLGGYAFATTWRLTRYVTRRHDGQHVYLRAGVFGAVLFIAAFTLRFALLHGLPAYASFDHRLEKLVQPLMKDAANSSVADIVIVAVYSLLLGLVVPRLLNIFTPQRPQLAKTASEFDLVMMRAQRADMPVLVTLENGKVYVGLVVKIIDPERNPATITLFPLVSGHRDALGKIAFTTDYYLIYQRLFNDTERMALGMSEEWQRHFEVVIRAERILSIRMFSTQVYAAFSASKPGVVVKTSDDLGESDSE